MGRVNQAMRRARQSGLATEFEPIAAGAYDASVLSTEPFPAETAPEPVAAEPAVPDPPKVAPVSRVDDPDADIHEIFFGTYPEKVWGRQGEIDRLGNLLTKVKRLNDSDQR